MSVYAQTISTFGVIIALIIIHRKSDKTEKYLIFKLIGYYFLGSLNFSFNRIAIPLGFLIYVIAFYPKINAQNKRNAAVIGLIIFIVSIAVPKYDDYLFTRPIEIRTESTNLFDRTLNQEWINIRDNLNLDNAQVQNFQADFERDGEIKSLRYQLVGYNEQGLVLSSIELFGTKKAYIIHRSKIDQGQANYNYNLIPANEFFDLLVNVNLEEILPKKEYPWYSIQVQGNTNTFDSSVKDNSLLLTRQGVKSVTEQQYPIQGLSVSVFGMTMTSETSSSSSDFKHYILVR